MYNGIWQLRAAPATWANRVSGEYPMKAKTTGSFLQLQSLLGGVTSLGMEKKIART